MEPTFSKRSARLFCLVVNALYPQATTEFEVYITSGCFDSSCESLNDFLRHISHKLGADLAGKVDCWSVEDERCVDGDVRRLWADFVAGPIPLPDLHLAAEHQRWLESRLLLRGGLETAR